MSSKTLTSKFGYFGKVPDIGDYIQSGVTVEFTDIWSEWLQSVLAVSKEQLSNRWLETFLTSPVWHFSISPGLCGDKTVIGTMMPSIDQVGRHYFFTTIREVELSPYYYWKNRGWSEKAESHLLKLFDDNNSLEDWLSVFSNNDWLVEQDFDISEPRIVAKNPKGIVLEDISELSEDVLVHYLLEFSFGNYCIWWTSGSKSVEQCKVVTSGLPFVGQFSAMLDGEWENWGW